MVGRHIGQLVASDQRSSIVNQNINLASGQRLSKGLGPGKAREIGVNGFSSGTQRSRVGGHLLGTCLIGRVVNEERSLLLGKCQGCGGSDAFTGTCDEDCTHSHYSM